MSFLKGTDPIRRTLKHLDKGLCLKEFIKVVIFHVTSKDGFSEGTRQFVYWRLNQLQYKNPDVQFSVIQNVTNLPYIQCILSNGQNVTIDTDSRNEDEIHKHLAKLFERPEKETETLRNKADDALFSKDHKRHCMCEIPGQRSCPIWVSIPEEMTGKYKFKKLHEERES